jgi:hypothetical protein
VHSGDAETFKASVSADGTVRVIMAPRVRQATRARAVQGKDTDAVATSSSRHHSHQRRGTNSIYTQNSNSSLLLADDEDSSAGSPDEVDGALR